MAIICICRETSAVLPLMRTVFEHRAMLKTEARVNIAHRKFVPLSSRLCT